MQNNSNSLLSFRVSRLVTSAVLVAAFGPLQLAAQSAKSAKATRPATAPTVPTLAVDITANRHPIDRHIYGIASGVDPAFAAEIQLPLFRWGGDATTRYNWNVDSTNAGFDWYFMSGGGVSSPAVPGQTVDNFIKSYAPAGADSLITIPIIPFINKSATTNCSYPVVTYGPQEYVNPYVQVAGGNCGNSISTTSGQLIDTDIYANHVDNTTAIQQGWIQHLGGTFGNAAHGGVLFYQLDNEPGGWSYTHRDVEPLNPDYPTIVALGQSYAAMIKATDPSANVLGPSDFTHGGWIGNPGQQGGLFAGQYYLQQMAAYDQLNHQRVLDYFDEHYYPAYTDAASQLEASRTLWDPTYNSGNWVEKYYFDGPMMLLPRFQNWISTYYPGTKLAISEYSIDSGKNSIVDGLAEMDMLGVFGRQQLDLANMWSPPNPTTNPVAYAFRMFRNYDGNGSQYGDTWVNAASTDQSQLSVYAAQRSSDNAVTVLVLNKTTQAIASSIALADVNVPPTAQVYSYSAANLQKIVHAADASIQQSAIAYNFPAYSGTMFVIQPTDQVASTTILSTSAISATAGTSITFTASISGVGGTGTPGGSVTFFDGITNIGSGMVSGSAASFSTSTLAVGPHSISATYSGDSNYLTSTSNTLVETITSAIPPGIVLSTAGTHNFGAVYQGSTMNYYIRVSNNSGSTFPFSMTFGSVVDFTLSNNCGTKIKNKVSCTIHFAYKAGSSAVYPPGSPKSLLETVDWSINNPGNVPFTALNGAVPGNSGTLLAIALNTKDLVLNTSAHNFGESQVGAISQTFGLNIYNGSGNSVSLAYSLSGDTTQFIVTNLVNPCPDPIPAHGECTISVQFTPTQLGSFSMPLTFTAGGKKPILPSSTVLFSGVAVDSEFTISTGGHNFGTQAVGTTSPGVYGVTLRNNTTNPLALSFAMGDSADFTVTSNNCGMQLAADGYCNIAFVFNPTTTGFIQTVYAVNASYGGLPVPLTVLGDSTDTPIAGVTLKGTGQ